METRHHRRCRGAGDPAAVVAVPRVRGWRKPSCMRDQLTRFVWSERCTVSQKTAQQSWLFPVPTFQACPSWGSPGHAAAGDGGTERESGLTSWSRKRLSDRLSTSSPTGRRIKFRTAYNATAEERRKITTKVQPLPVHAATKLLSGHAAETKMGTVSRRQQLLLRWTAGDGKEDQSVQADCVPPHCHIGLVFRLWVSISCITTKKKAFKAAECHNWVIPTFVSLDLVHAPWSLQHLPVPAWVCWNTVIIPEHNKLSTPWSHVDTWWQSGLHHSDVITNLVLLPRY